MSDPLQSSTNGPPSRPQPKNRAWVWYFVLLADMTVATTTILIAYNVSQQLTMQKFEAAHALWKKRGPADYDMDYSTQTTAETKFHVRVRGGNVVEATMNGEPIEPRLYSHRTMNGLLSDVQRFLEIDQKPGSPRAYVRATFDGSDGHLVRYVRSVSETRERVEIVVTKFEAVEK
jgi:hypothetical protein